MRAVLAAVLLAAVSASPAAVHAETAAIAKAKAAYKVEETDLGTLLDDPVAKAILARHIPTLIASEQIDMARSMTLVQLQQFAGDQLKDDVIAKIQTDLDAASPK